jgi:hypothetical protein
VDWGETVVPKLTVGVGGGSEVLPQAVATTENPNKITTLDIIFASPGGVIRQNKRSKTNDPSDAPAGFPAKMSCAETKEYRRLVQTHQLISSLRQLSQLSCALSILESN